MHTFSKINFPKGNIFRSYAFPVLHKRNSWKVIYLEFLDSYTFMLKKKNYTHVSHITREASHSWVFSWNCDISVKPWETCTLWWWIAWWKLYTVQVPQLKLIKYGSKNATDWIIHCVCVCACCVWTCWTVITKTLKIETWKQLYVKLNTTIK